MGLQMTLTKQNNKLFADFKDAYWAVTDLAYSTDQCAFKLEAFPTRESKIKRWSEIGQPTLPFGSPNATLVDSSLYLWQGVFPITSIFPSGIPLDANEQKTAVYNFIKSYTSLPFEDVFEQ